MLEQLSTFLQTLSKLTNNKIQTIINHFSKNSDTDLPDSSIDNSENKISEEDKYLPEIEISISNETHVSDSSSLKLSQENNPEIKSFNPTHARAHFRNKILEQYPDLYYEYNKKIDHKLIFFFKTGRGKIAKLIGVLTDKIHSKLYKRCKNETGLDPWIKSETSGKAKLRVFDSSSQISSAGMVKKDTDNYIPQGSLTISNKTRNFSISGTNPSKIEHGEGPEKISNITEAEKVNPYIVIPEHLRELGLIE
ncbi:hypothetical protein Glove_120g173 [Diversispora epigaea]|uniref:Uncharacterized protein n=1 Tax=Diversispora epigaea TaxID=1348612 RepID=A0A397J460_9GLOM|nr:hypothetical protein Glove_120g173 [Diversispora epigaea]